ncbi:Choline dehydrogenase [Lasiodiplodia theobromae]|uniref:Choline dehydrogenase n=1 Tax=Lasiodiplodia theobromae TaxID=45133 RepID=UPI0015C3B90C|nr:Choline dehydrogenase [Lasiodiplodia theobromae]KAF4535039.1 Choline dehydrogenase [Lasiodiplodia theobromae]
MLSRLVSLNRPMLLYGAALLLSRHVHSQSISGVTPADVANKTYDFVVIGSGPGGGPLAANLAIAGHSVLLLEAGEDHGDTLVQQVPELYPQAIHVPDQRWDFFVRYHANDDLHNNYEYFTWRTSNGSYHVGQSPPPGSERLGAYYPRAGTLGGSATRNAMISIQPPASDWEYISNITGDDTWGPSNMHRLFQRLERNHYLPNGTEGHGFSGYLGQSQPNPAVVEQQPQFSEVLESLAAELGHNEPVEELLRGDVNSADPQRDTTQGLYGFAQHIDAQGRRSDARTRVYTVSTATNPDGSKKFPLDVMFNALATRVLFDNATAGNTPRATGVEFLWGSAMYSADPRYNANSTGESGIVRIKKEAIVSGGAFNSPQILKLSGIGPADELSHFDIPVIVDLPGVGNNLQDNYETSVIAHASTDFENNGPACTMGTTEDDPCLELWLSRGIPRLLPSSSRDPWP